MVHLGGQGEVIVVTQVDGIELGVDGCQRVSLEGLEIGFRRPRNGVVDESHD